MVMIKMAVSTRPRLTAKALNCLEELHEQEVEVNVSPLDELDFVQALPRAPTPATAPSGSSRARTDSQRDAIRIINQATAQSEFSILEVGKTKAEDEAAKSYSIEPLLPNLSHTPAGSADVGKAWRGRFTPKEIRILALLVQGSTCETIATHLNAPERTIKNYLRALVSTTGLSDLSELAAFAVLHGLLEPPPEEY